MQLFYFKTNLLNVGDDFNIWLFPRLLPGRLTNSGPFLVGIGSVLDRRIDDLPGEKIVFGTGARSRESVPKKDDLRILFVRGPKTAAALGGVRFITDPAYLVGDYFSIREPGHKTGFISYFRNDGMPWGAILSGAGIRPISTNQTVDSFLKDLSQCRAVFCESMHGAIFADALGIPWRPVQAWNLSNEGDVHYFKWQDWCDSMDMAFSPVKLPLLSAPQGFLEKVKVRIMKRRLIRTLSNAEREGFSISSDHIRKRKLAELREAVSELQGVSEVSC